MKKNTKLIVTILVVLILGVLITLTSAIKDMDISNSLYNVCFWLVIPSASVILGGLYLKKHLWLSLVAVLGLDVLLWLAAFGYIAILNNGTNTEGIAFICMIIQEVITLILIIGIYVYHAIRGR